jgi:hypothetical protein
LQKSQKATRQSISTAVLHGSGLAIATVHEYFNFYSLCACLFSTHGLYPAQIPTSVKLFSKKILLKADRKGKQGAFISACESPSHEKPQWRKVQFRY